MKKIFVLLFVLPAVLCLRAQTALDLSLDKARRLALAHWPALQINQLNRQIADAAFREGRLRYLPQWSAGYDLRANLVLPTTIVPGGPFDQTGNLQVQFGTLWSQTAGLEMQQTIYDRGLREDQRLLNLNRQIAEAQAALGQDELQLATVKSYYNVLVQHARLLQQEAAVLRLQLDVAEADSLVQAGLAPDIELDRFQNAFKNALLERDRIRFEIEIAENALKNLTGLPAEQHLRLTDTLDVDNLRAAALLVPVVEQTQMNNFAAFRLENLHAARIEQEITSRKAEAAPSLSLYGYVGGQAFTNNYRVEFPWYGVAFVGIQARWKINPAWDNKRVLPRYQMLKRQSDIRLKQMEEDFRYGAEEARLRLLQAIDAAEIQLDNATFARKALSHYSEGFRKRQNSAREVMEAEQELAAAETGLLVSVYQVWIVRHEYLKAMGRL